MGATGRSMGELAGDTIGTAVDPDGESVVGGLVGNFVGGFLGDLVGGDGNGILIFLDSFLLLVFSKLFAFFSICCCCFFVVVLTLSLLLLLPAAVLGMFLLLLLLSFASFSLVFIAFFFSFFCSEDKYNRKEAAACWLLTEGSTWSSLSTEVPPVDTYGRCGPPSLALASSLFSIS